jgi:hypothetical protein
LEREVFSVKKKKKWLSILERTSVSRGFKYTGWILGVEDVA